MLIIGLLLFGAAIAVGADVVAVNDAAVDVDAFGQIFSTSVGIVFLAGAVTALVGCFGLMLMTDGAVHRRRLSAEAKAARAERRDVDVERENIVERQEALDLRERAERGTDREIGSDEQVDRRRHRLLHRTDS